MKTLTPLAAMILFTSGCVAQDKTRFPSLLPRPIEIRSDAEPEAVAVAATPDPALDATLVGYRKTLDETIAAFAPAATLAEQRARAAKGDGVGGERWINAQTALADLDGYRADTSGIVNDIEQTAIARAAAGMPDYPALETIRAAAQRELDTETARITAIQGSLPGA